MHAVEFAYILDRVSSINDLGVIIDEKMYFLEHVDVMVGTAFAMLEFIRTPLFEFRDPYTLKSLYTSLVRPKLEYASCVRSPFYDVSVNKVERVQRRFKRYALRGWVGRILMIYHRMSIDVLFCAMKLLQNGALSPV
jgi:hypothetical protein